MGGKAARTKGHSFERFIAIELRKIDPTAMRNVAETQQASVDINTRLPLAIQCKALKRWSLTPHSIYAQACDGARKPTDVPITIVKIDNKSPQLVTMALEHFLQLMEAMYGETARSDCQLQLQSWLSLSKTTSTT